MIYLIFAFCILALSIIQDVFVGDVLCAIEMDITAIFFVVLQIEKNQRK